MARRLVAIAGDIVEFAVARPPTTKEAALRLAIEQYAYCYDIVDQGTGTIEVLAASLIGSPAVVLLVGLRSAPNPSILIEGRPATRGQHSQGDLRRKIQGQASRR